MNYIFPVMVVLSIVFSIFNGTVNETIQSGFDGAKRSVEIVLSFAGIMCMWSGFLKVAQEGGALGALTKIISPVTHLLFPRLDKKSKAIENICANFSANLLGVGNAATPSGIAAMNELDKINKNPLVASDEMCIFTVINTASLQLVPSTVIALRQASGSQNPQSIVPMVLFASATSVVFAVLMMFIILKLRKKSICMV